MQSSLSRLPLPLWCWASGWAAWQVTLGRHSTVFALATTPLALGGWAFVVWRTRRPMQAATVLLDALAHANGLLLTGGERRLGDWRPELHQKLARMRWPPLSWKPSALGILSALVFILAVSLLPPRTVRTPLTNVAATDAVTALEKKAEGVERELPKDANLDAELARLREDLSQARFDAADWEAADGLAKTFETRAAEASGQLMNAQKAAQALVAARAASSAASSASSDAASRAEEALERALLKASQGRAGTESASTGKPLTPQQLTALQAALANRQAALAKAFGQAPPSTPPSASATASGTQATPASGSGSGPGPPTNAMAGISRGGGPGEHRFDESAALHPERLALHALPHQSGDAPGGLLGLQAADPVLRVEASVGGRPVVQVSGAASPGKRSEVLLPRNQELVRRFFGVD